MTSGAMENEALLLSSLQVASQSWAAFDWVSKAKQWDSTSSQAKEARDQSVAARKQLSDSTKQFKASVKAVQQAGTALNAANTPDNVGTTVKSIDALAKQCRQTVKSYQEEIDNLTRRCKLSEGAFGSLHQSLSEVPDPASVLTAAVEHINTQQKQMSQLLQTVDELNKEIANMGKNANTRSSESDLGKAEREELMQLRRDVAEYEVEFRSLKNQDITIRKLEARILELQQAGEGELKEKLEKAKQELAETEGRRATEALEREAAMERQVQTLELQLKAEMAGREAAQTHLLEADEGAGEREAAWEAQRRILVEDSERLRETLHEATRERDELRLRVAALEGGARSPSAPPSGGIAMSDLLLERKAYEAELVELSQTANSLREELALKDDMINQEKRTLQSNIEAMEREQASLRSTLTSLEAQLAAAPSQSLVDSMKRELRILKRLEYNAEDVEMGDDRDPEMTGGNEDQEKDLESVLVAKLRRVESELVKERIQRSETVEECNKLKEEIAEAENAKQQAEKLIRSLEADLDRAISTPTVPEATHTTIEPIGTLENPDTLESVLDPNAPKPLPSRKSVATTTASEKAEDDHSVATIIMAQRDRLRARCEALEAERDSFKRELQAQVQAAESLKSDNTKLFEKMRYLQSYTSGPPSGRRNVQSRGKVAADRDLDLEALEQRYEASVDPFRQFSRAERQRKLQEMSPMERTVFVVAKTVLGTKEMRTFLFVYVVAMHFLVFLTTYHWSHSESTCSIANNEHLSHLPPVPAAQKVD